MPQPRRPSAPPLSSVQGRGARHGMVRLLGSRGSGPGRPGPGLGARARGSGPGLGARAQVSGLGPRSSGPPRPRSRAPWSRAPNPSLSGPGTGPTPPTLGPDNALKMPYSCHNFATIGGQYDRELRKGPNMTTIYITPRSVYGTDKYYPACPAEIGRASCRERV